MTQQKPPSTSPGLFGLTGRDIVLLVALVIGLALGLIPAYQLVRHQQKEAQPATTPSTQEIAQTPIGEQPQATATRQPTDTSLPATATSLPPTPTKEQPNSTPTNVPPTSTITPTEAPSATSTATNIATATPSAEPTAEPTQQQTVEPTQEVITEPTSEPPNVPTTQPTPQPATVLYVQSSGQTHNLGLVTSGGGLINANLHAYAAAPAWSPGQTQIAFFGEPDINTLGGPYLEGEGIWLTNSQGGNPDQLVKINHVRTMAWSPDGLKLAYEFGPPEKTHEIIVIDARDGQKINNFPGEQPAWSPNSQKLIIKACAPGCGLWQVNLDGSGGEQMTFHQSDSYPSWSPDEQYLAFSSRRNDDWEIYRLRLADSELIRLTDRPGTDTTPVFSPDSQEIYLRTDTFGDWRITKMGWDGSNEVAVLTGIGSSDDWGLARPAVR